MKRIIAFIICTSLLLALVTAAFAEQGMTYAGLEYIVTDNEVTITGYTDDLPDDVVIPESINELPVTAIKELAFCGSSMKSISIPTTVKSIGEGVFFNCELDDRINLNNNSHFFVSGGMIYNENGTILYDTYSDEAEWQNDYEETLTKVGYGAFENSSVYRNLPNIKTVAPYGFKDAKITELNMAGLKEIEESGFSGAQINAAYFGGLEKVGNKAFEKASGNIYFMCDAPDFADDAFADVQADMLKVYYAKGTVGWDNLAFENVVFEEFEPKVLTIKFFQIFEETEMAQEPFATQDVYENLSLTYESLPDFPNTDGYIIGNGEKTGLCKKITSDMDLNFKINYYYDEAYTVTFKESIGDTIIDTQEIKRSYDATYPKIPQFDGLEFIGWSDSAQRIMNDKIIYAEYRLADGFYPIRFYDGFLQMNGSEDSLICEMILQEGSEIVYPDAPEHDGYVFAGWDSDIKQVSGPLSITAIYVNDSELLLGDANLDGVVNTADAVVILRHSVNLITLSDVQFALGNVNGDDVINIADAVNILKYAAGLIINF